MSSWPQNMEWHEPQTLWHAQEHIRNQNACRACLVTRCHSFRPTSLWQGPPSETWMHGKQKIVKMVAMVCHGCLSLTFMMALTYSECMGWGGQRLNCDFKTQKTCLRWAPKRHTIHNDHGDDLKRCTSANGAREAHDTRTHTKIDMTHTHTHKDWLCKYLGKNM